MPRIVVKVGHKGKILADFVGFGGDKCLAEAQALERALKSFGLRAEVADQHMKSQGQIREEVGDERSLGNKGPNEAR